MQQITELLDSQVLDNTGQLLGCIEEILVSSTSGHVQAVIVKTKNHTRMRIPWALLSIRSDHFGTIVVRQR
ncbi:MAG: PRC-barrel domain-containing protein [bacterium]